MAEKDPTEELWIGVKEHPKSVLIAQELWSIFPKTLNSRLLTCHVIDLVRRFTAYLSPAYSEAECVSEFVNELILFRSLKNAKAATRGDVTGVLTRPATPNSLSFEEFCAFLTDYYFVVVLNPQPQTFKLLYKTLLDHVTTWLDDATHVEKCHVLPQIDDYPELKASAILVSECVPKKPTFARKCVTNSRRLLDLQKIVPLGRFARSFIKDIVANGFVAQFENSDNLKNLVVTENRFLVMFAIESRHHVLRLAGVSHLQMLYEKLLLKTGEKAFVDVLDVSNDHTYDPAARLKHLTRKGKNIDYTSQLTPINFSHSKCLSLRLAYARARKLSGPPNPIVGDDALLLKRPHAKDKVVGAEKWLFEKRIRPDPPPKKPFVFLVFGKPFTGKSTLARAMAQAMQIPLIDVDDLLAKFVTGEVKESVLEEVAQLQQKELASLKEGNPASLVLLKHLLMLRLHEVNSAEGLIIEVGSVTFEEEIFKELLNFLDNEDLVPRSMLFSEKPKAPEEAQNHSSVNAITKEKKNNLPIIFIELKLSDEDVCLRAANAVFSEGKTSRVMTEFDAIELTMKKTRAEFLASSEASEDLLNFVSKLPEAFKTYTTEVENFQTTISSTGIRLEAIEAQLQRYSSVSFELLDLLKKTGSYYVPINALGLSPQSICALVLDQISDKIVYKPVALEPSDSVLQLTIQGKEIEAFEPPRGWSEFADVDCVELLEKQAITIGSPSISVSHLNKLYMFTSEQNRQAFLSFPDKYICRKPSCSGKINLSIYGSTEVRPICKTIADKLGLLFIDPAEFLLKELAREIHAELLPEGVAYVGNKHYEELLAAGQKLDLNILPALILISRQIALDLQPSEEEEKSLAQKEWKKKTKKEAKPVTIENLVTKECRSRALKLIEQKLKANENPDQPAPEEELPLVYTKPLKGYLFYNYPATQSQFEQLNQFNLAVDRFVWMFPESAENADDVDTTVTFDALLTGFEPFKAFLTQKFQNDEVMTLPFSGTGPGELVITEILDFANPFKPKIDTEKFSVDIEEGPGKMPVPFHDFGKYCPVSLHDQHLFCFGKKEYFSTMKGRKIYFLNESCKNQFSKNYQQYLDFHRVFLESFYAVRKFYLMGSVGSGLRTVSSHLAKQLKTKVCHLQNDLIAKKMEKIRAIVDMFELRKGFLEPTGSQEEADGSPEKTDQQIIELYRSIPNVNEPDLEKELIRDLLKNDQLQVIIIDPFTSEKNSAVLSTGISEILAEIEFSLDHVIVLRNGEYKALKNVFDETAMRNELQVKNDQMMADYQEQKRNQPQDDPDAPEIPEPTLIDINAEVEGAIEKLKGLRESQLQKIQEMCESFKEAGAFIHYLDTEMPLVKLLNDSVRLTGKIVEMSLSEFRRAEILAVSDEAENPELFSELKVEKLLKSGDFNLSQFRLQNCLNPYKRGSPEFAFALQQEIYFVSSKEELERVSANPRLIPRHLNINFERFSPKIFCLLPILSKAFKNEVIKQLNLTPLSFKRIIKTIFQVPNCKRFDFGQFPDLRLSKIAPSQIFCPETDNFGPFNPYDLSVASVHGKFVSGACLTDEEKVFLATLFFSTPSVKSKGFFIQSFPENLRQARLLCDAGVIPSLVLTFDTDAHKFCKELATHKGYSEDQLSIFANDRFGKIAEIEAFYSQQLDNLVTIDRSKSPFINSQILAELLEKGNIQRMKACENFNKDRPVSMVGLNISHEFAAQRTFKTGTFAADHSLSRASLNLAVAHQIFFRNQIFYTADKLTDKQLERLASNMEKMMKFSVIDKFDLKLRSMLLANPLFSENTSADLKEEDFCPVCIGSNNYQLANRAIEIEYNKKEVFFCSAAHLSVFLKNPKLFSFLKFEQKSMRRAGKPRVAVPEDKAFVDRLLQAMNQVTGLRVRFPNLSLKETSLVLLALLLRSMSPKHPNVSQRIYQQRVEKVIRFSQLPGQLSKEYLDKVTWTESEREIFLKNTEEFLKEVGAMERLGKRAYFKPLFE